MNAALLPLALHLPARRDVWQAATSGVTVRVPAVPRCSNPERRRACRFDLAAFKATYFPRYVDSGSFHQEFLAELQRLALARTVRYAAWAASRGIGKTTDKVIADIWVGLYSHRRFAAWITSGKGSAEDRLGMIQAELLHNDLLCDDFPEICQPIRDFGGDPRAAHPYVWSAHETLLPNGFWLCAYGIDGSLLGMIRDSRRPDWVTIDDPESEDTVRSTTETLYRRRRIEKEVSFLHGMGERCSYLMLATVRAPNCIADEFTDPQRRPDWNGRRFPAMLKEPSRMDLWQQFMAMARPDAAVPPATRPDAEIAAAIGMAPEHLAELDPGYRRGLAFFAEHRAEMNDADMLDPILLPVHQYFYTLATKGEDVVGSELQQNPQADPNVHDRQLTELTTMARRAAGTREGLVPEWAAWVTVSIDVGLYRLHWEADAWSPDGQTSQLIFAGIEETRVNDGGRMRAMASAAGQRMIISECLSAALERIRARAAGLLPLRDEIDPDQQVLGFSRANGTRLRPVLHGIDSGGQATNWAWQDIIFHFCERSGPTWVPLKGERWTESISDRAMGRLWICEEKNNPGRRFDCNADQYKLRVYDAYQLPMQTADGAPVRGARLLHMDDAKHSLIEYARHQCAEKHVIEILPNKEVAKAERVGWHLAGEGRNRANHWFDTAWMQYALIEIWTWMRQRRRPAAIVGPDQTPSAPAGPNPMHS